MILISACLLNLCTKYDGTSNKCQFLMDYTKLGKYIPVCPEQLGGLSTPRVPLEIVNGSGEDVLAQEAKVVDEEGKEYTREFIRGAEEVLKIALTFPINAAILKERSPSCGSRQIYDGSFTGKTISGQGVTSALLRKNNIPVYSEETISKQELEKLLS